MDRMMDRIKYYRQRSGQTQAQVANKLGMAVSNYQKYELGAREPLEKNLPALADALGCSAYSLQESDKERFIRIYNKFVRERPCIDGTPIRSTQRNFWRMISVKISWDTL